MLLPLPASWSFCPGLFLLTRLMGYRDVDSLAVSMFGRDGRTLDLPRIPTAEKKRVTRKRQARKAWRLPSEGSWKEDNTRRSPPSRASLRLTE